MRGVLAGMMLCAGCSFIGAHVPDKPPAPETCPQGVIVADFLGAAPTTLFTILGAVAIAKNDSQAAVLAVYITPVTGVLALTYISSAIYGISASGRCRRLQAASQQ